PTLLPYTTLFRSTATAAAVRVPGDDVVIDAEPVPEGLAPAAQHIVRGIHDALLDVHVEAAPHLVDERIECGRGHPGHAGLPFPFLSGPARRLEARHPVDRRAAAGGLTREHAERQVSRRQHAVTLKHRVVRLGLPLPEGLRGAIRPRVEDE